MGGSWVRSRWCWGAILVVFQAARSHKWLGVISQVVGCDLVGVGVRRDQCDLGLCAQSQQLCPLFAI